MSVSRIVAGLLLVVVSATPLMAQPLSPQLLERASQLAEEALADTLAYGLVESLTTEVGPRLAGTGSEARARQWAVAKLKALGFANVRIEPFELPVWVRGVERAEITAPFPQPLVITALGGSVATGPDGVEGELVAFASLADFTDAPAINRAGQDSFLSMKP